MRLAAGCFLVGSGRLGMEMTSPWDCHVYLLVSDTHALLIDAGCGRSSAEIIGNVERHLGNAELIGIALTHGHIDHSGGAASISKRFGVPVYIDAACVTALKSADRDSTGLNVGVAEGIYPADQTLDPVPAIRAIPSGGFDLGGLVVRCVATPGHSYDHSVFVADLPEGRAVWTGDLIFSRGRVAVLDSYDTDIEAYKRSVHEVSKLRPDLLFPGHGSPVLQRASEHVEVAWRKFESGGTPKGLVN